ncbi:MAG: cell wall hydrolase [Anaerovorax sp.]|nr:cell wall hydrolase [Anaerovorax sp.]
MNKIKAIRPFFLTICLIFSITLFLINASSPITLIDIDSSQKASQLSKSAKNKEITNNTSNIEQLPDASFDTEEDKPISSLDEQNNGVQNVVSRGTSNRNTYSTERAKPKKTAAKSATPTEASSNSIPQAIPSTQSQTKSQSENDLDLLARLITAEAQGEPYDAKVAVGAVVINRLESGLWANTIKDVIYQKINGYYQFTPVANGWINKPAKPESIEAAKAAMRGVDPTNGAQFYYDDNCTNEWILSKPISIQIGHMVYAY